MENVRFNISPCTKAEVDAYISGLDTEVYVPNGSVKSTERSHYDRYSFLCSDQRIAIVYDITAKIVSITARFDLAKQLLDAFDTNNKSVKRSSVPAQGGARAQQDKKQTVAQNGEHADAQTASVTHAVDDSNKSRRAKLFVPPDALKRRGEYAPVPTVLATSRGIIVTTDEIFPPQTVKRKVSSEQSQIEQPQKRPLTSYGETRLNGVAQKTEHAADNDKQSCGIAISVGNRTAGSSLAPRRAVISFGSDDDGKAAKPGIKINTRSGVQSDKAVQAQQQTPQPQDEQKKKRGRPKKSDKQAASDNSAENSNLNKQQPQQNQQKQPAQPQQQNAQAQSEQPQKRKRGRPKKSEIAERLEAASLAEKTPEYKNGYSVKNYPPEALNGAVRRLREYGKTVISDGVEFGGTPQEVKSYTVTDANGQKVILRYATKRMTLQLQGKRSLLFGEVMAQVSRDSDYSSALENYVEKAEEQTTGSRTRSKVSDVQNKLKKRLPTAYGYLSEQSRIDFSYGIHDFAQKDLHLSDYSVLLVPAFRGLERFVFDLQVAENINVKMIGQAFDKDDSGRYVLKSGYLRRIDSVIYPEVLVSLYTEYFMQRNFFAHSDNTGGNVSRSLPERADAQRIFEHLLDIVEYNARKLKEIGFAVHK